jgi:MtN3 and saliva related transmembrane protein
VTALWLQDAVGSLAGFLTTASFLPQVIKTWRSRSTRDISLTMWLMFSVGVALWVFFGFLAESWPIVVTNAVTLVLAVMVLWLKIANRGRE